MSLLQAALTWWALKQQQQTPNQYPVKLSPQEEWLFNTIKGYLEKPSPERQAANSYNLQFMQGIGNMGTPNPTFASDAMRGQSFAGGLQLPKIDLTRFSPPTGSGGSDAPKPEPEMPTKGNYVSMNPWPDTSEGFEPGEFVGRPYDQYHSSTILDRGKDMDVRPPEYMPGYAPASSKGGGDANFNRDALNAWQDSKGLPAWRGYEGNRFQNWTNRNADTIQRVSNWLTPEFSPLVRWYLNRNRKTVQGPPL